MQYDTDIEWKFTIMLLYDTILVLYCVLAPVWERSISENAYNLTSGELKRSFREDTVPWTYAQYLFCNLQSSIWKPPGQSMNLHLMKEGLLTLLYIKAGDKM